jgi:acetyl esterase/lipase
VAGLGKANRGYGLELAERGYVVLAPDYPSFGDLANYDFAADRYTSGTMKGIVNHIRGVDLLQSRPEVDPERIGVIGHSLGGHNAMFVGVFDERLKVIVSSCGWTPFHDYYEGNIKGWTSDRYMPLLRDAYGLNPDRVPFDFYEVVAALAPRAFFSASPVRDSNFEVAGVRRAEPIAREVYDLLGAGDRLVVRYPECEHDFPPEVRLEAYEFVDRILGHTPPAR